MSIYILSYFSPLPRTNITLNRTGAGVPSDITTRRKKEKKKTKIKVYKPDKETRKARARRYRDIHIYIYIFKKRGKEALSALRIQRLSDGEKEKK